MNDANNKELLMQILKTLNKFQLQTITTIKELNAEMKEIKKEVQKNREIENAHWEENLRRWEQNERRWEENERRWKENEKLWKENKSQWEENRKLWTQYRIDRKTDHDEILEILMKFDLTISKKLGDPNVDRMKKVIDITKIKR